MTSLWLHTHGICTDSAIRAACHPCVATTFEIAVFSDDDHMAMFYSPSQLGMVPHHDGGLRALDAKWEPGKPLGFASKEEVQHFLECLAWHVFSAPTGAETEAAFPNKRARLAPACEYANDMEEDA